MVNMKRKSNGGGASLWLFRQFHSVLRNLSMVNPLFMSMMQKEGLLVIVYVLSVECL
ncbi:hypothetical protein MED297_07981 [Reinekea sp. MED297]|uniref:Uncharacterized protein n=1 Tax=Reinekea blandensis MED297 TaxID=314283 RepID=A4BCS9_9GAMM|nr:hypothetical protein MED297_07981 [Reinekea sp. MED297] [Reinekea blandensis MED297]